MPGPSDAVTKAPPTSGRTSSGAAHESSANAIDDTSQGIALDCAATVASEEGRGPIKRDAIFRRMLAVADLCAAAGGLAVVGALSGQGMALASLATVPVVVLVAKLIGRYDHDEVVLRKSTLDEAPVLLVLSAAFAIVWSLVASIAGLHLGLRGAEVIVLTAVTTVLLITFRAVARALARLSAPRERVLIIGSASARARVANCLDSDPWARTEVAGFLPLEEEWPVPRARGEGTPYGGPPGAQDLLAVIRQQQIDRVFVIPTSEDSETMLDVVSRTISAGVKVSIVPRLFEVVGSAVEFDTVGGVTVLGLRRPGLTRSSYAVKRMMDTLGSSLGLLLLAPLGGLIALAIKLDSRGPVFFRQLRVGRGGRTFTLIKFRSMIDGAEAQRASLADANESDGIFKLSADPRVTRVGRFLRRTSLDEMPQLLNVLRGDMSLVGPRPLVVPEDRLVEGRHRERLRLTPGLTGPWQVLGPKRPPLGEMVKTDYLYAVNWTLWTDVKIILRTVSHVVGRRGL